MSDFFKIPSLPINRNIISSIDFYNRFTNAEQLALSQVIISNAQMHQWSLLATISPSIDLSNSTVIAGVHALANIGVITTDRIATILTS